MPENKKIKMLIADDDSFLLGMYSRKFAEKGLDIAVASDGAEALLKLRAGFAPDIVLLDVAMPNVDGFELMRTMSEEKLGENAVKIIFSNLERPSEMEAGKALGASGYIIKADFTPSQLEEKVMEIFLAEREKKQKTK